MTLQARAWACALIAVFVFGWSTFAFGSAADGFRSVAVGLTGVGGVMCIFLLPAPDRKIRIPILLAIGAGWLLLFGWFMVANARAEHDMVIWQFSAVESRLWAAGPGSVARASSLRSMLELSAVFIAVLAVLKSTESGAWRVLLKIMVGMGVLVALVGLLHKAAGARTVYWIDDTIVTGAPFAPFVYHANAGAFMNLCLPLSMGLWLGAVTAGRSRSTAIFWAMTSIVILAGLFASASKGAILVLGVTLSLMLIWNRRRLLAWLKGIMADRRNSMERVLLTVGMLVLGIVLTGFGIGLTAQRWVEFAGRFTDPDRETIDGRIGMLTLMSRMASPSEGSWHGFGPGTFRHLVPYFTAGPEGRGVISSGRWRHGHCDPMQTVVEWGYAGALGWLLIVFGAGWAAAALLRARCLETMDVPLIRGVSVALIGVGLHACFDFPLSNYSIHLVAMILCAALFGLSFRRLRKLPRIPR